MYKHGIDCEKQKNCKRGCKDCRWYNKEYLNDDFGICYNPNSEMKNQEVYNYSCCTYICQH